MKRILFLLSAFVALTACGGRGERAVSAEATETASAIAVANLAGTYVGVLPAADCPGMTVELTLCDDGTYVSRSEYLERDARFEERGRYTVEGTQLTLSAGEGEAAEILRIEADRLRWLDSEGNPVEGPQADCYLLTRKTTEQ